jgi:hypothetical protein
MGSSGGNAGFTHAALPSIDDDSQRFILSYEFIWTA